MPRRQLLGGGWEAGQPRQCTIMSSNRPDLRSLLAAASQADLRREPGVAMHHDKPTLMVWIPAGLQTSVEPSRPPQCLRCCGRFSPRVAAQSRQQGEDKP